MENLLFFGVPILKHITVDVKVKTITLSVVSYWQANKWDSDLGNVYSETVLSIYYLQHSHKKSSSLFTKIMKTKKPCWHEISNTMKTVKKMYTTIYLIAHLNMVFKNK